MSEQAPPGILQGADSPRDVTKCAFVRIVPVRFALSSEEAPPVQGRLPAYMQAVPERRNLKYTLRLLRNGYIHVFHKPDKQYYSWKVENGLVEQDTLRPSGGQENKPRYIYIPACWESVHIAFSDAPGEDFWHQYLDNEAQLLSRMHEVRWEKGSGISSPDTLCGSVDDMLEWVEEFRRSPGHVRALFEYEDNTVREYFDPDMDHLKPTNFSEAIVRRWQGTSSWNKKAIPLPQSFKWLLVKEREETESSFISIPRELKKHEFSGLTALSDPAGICLECAALHQASLKAWNDFATWYAHAHTLCLYLKEWDSMPGPFARQATVYDPVVLRSYQSVMDNPRFSDHVSDVEQAVHASGRPISEAFLPWFKRGMTCLDPHLETLAEFWLAWLNGTDRFSFSRAAEDYDTGVQRGSDGWEKLLSLCTHKITAHERVLPRIREDFERDSPLAGMFRERLKNSLWASDEDDHSDEHMGFTLLLINFAGLLPSRLDMARGMKAMPPYAEEMFTALCEILIKKLGKVPPDSPETDHLDLMKFLVAAQGLASLPETGSAGDKVPFGILLRSSVSLDKLGEQAGRDRDFEIAAHLLKTGELAVQSFQHFLKRYPLLRQTVRIIAAHGSFTGGGRGAGPAPVPAPEDRRLSPGSTGLLNLAGLGIAAATLLQSLHEQATDKKRGYWGWVDVAANAFGVIELYHKSKLTLFSRPYEIVAAPLGELLERSPAWTRGAAGYAKLPFTAACAGRLAGVGAAIWSAYTAMEEAKKGEDRVALGNWLLAAGAGLLLVKGAALGGLAFSIAGLVFVMFGKTSRLQYRIANCYFGEKNEEFPEILARYDTAKTVKRPPADFVKKYIESAGEFNPESYQAVVPFSLKKGFVPAELEKDRKAPEFYEKRNAQLTLDLKTLELSLLCVSLTALHDRANGLIHVHLTVPFAAPSATLRVKSLSFIIRNSASFGGDVPVCEISELKSIRMGCTFKNGRPCWFFAFPVPDNVAQAQQDCELWNLANTQTGIFRSLLLEAKVDFEYASKADEESLNNAVNLLRVEDAAYHDVDDDFNPRTEEECRVLRDYTLTGGIIPLTSSAR